MHKDRIVLGLLALLAVLSLAACGDRDAGQPERTPESPPEDTQDADKGAQEAAEAAQEAVLNMRIGDTAVSVVWEDTEAVAALRDRLQSGPLTVEMSRYGGFEQVGALGVRLPQSDVQTRTEAGDIVLYTGDRLVVFYGSNSWAYTRLGKITGLSAQELADLLGGADVTVTLSLE